MPYRCGIYVEKTDEKMKNNIEEAKKYMPYIYDDARSYKSAMERGDYNKAASEAEQIGEKSIKAIAQKNGRLTTTMKRKHGHDLVYLARECGEKIQAEKDELHELSDPYFNGRYPEGNRRYNKEEAEKRGKIACKLADQAIEELDISNMELDREFGEQEHIEDIEDLNFWNRLMK